MSAYFIVTEITSTVATSTYECFINVKTIFAQMWKQMQVWKANYCFESMKRHVAPCHAMRTGELFPMPRHATSCDARDWNIFVEWGCGEGGGEGGGVGGLWGIWPYPVVIRIRLGFGLRDTIDSSTAPQLHGPAGLGASAPQLRGFRDCIQGYAI